MGKKYVSVASRRLRAAANRKNLEFLVDTKQEVDMLVSYPEDGGSLPVEALPAVNGGTQRKKDGKVKTKSVVLKHTVPSTAANFDQPAEKRKRRAEEAQYTTQSTMLGALGLFEVSPNKNKEVLDIQMEFIQDWEQPEELDYNTPGPSTKKAAPIVMQAGKTNELVPSCGEKLKRTYPAKRAESRNSTGLLAVEEIVIPDGHEKTNGVQPAIRNECHCGQQPNILELEKDNARMKAQITKLKQAYRESTNRCLKLTDTLNSKLLGEPHDTVFTELEGYPSRESLKAFSNQSIKSDYTFVKLVMDELWPTGFVNRSVTGRSSNNPLGRPRGLKNNPPAKFPTNPANRVPLEPEKVKYVQDRMLEHRIYRGDPPAIAKTLAKDAPNIMKRILAYYGKKAPEN